MDFYYNNKRIQNSFKIEGVTHPKPTADNLEEYRVLGVIPAKDFPTIDDSKQNIVLLDTPVEKDGFMYTYEVIDKTITELEIVMRAVRDAKLKNTDYYGLSDVTMSKKMATYRQALRDLPTTVDVTNPVYPTKP
jgi:hypothetical protein